MAKAPKCKACGYAHWSNQPHHYAEQVTKSVTPVVAEAVMITASVTETHECPVCGLLHHKSMDGAERQRRFRAKQKAVAN